MNEMRLSGTMLTPPGGYQFKHPISGLHFERHTWSLLRMDVTNHCAANGYPEVSDDEIQQQMCERLGPKLAKRFCTGDGVSVEGVSLKWTDILNGTKVMAGFILAGRPLVDRAEAERRAEICSLCSRNVPYHKPCGGDCPELEQVVTTIVGSEGTARDLELHACSVCRCSNKAQVWVPIEHLKRGVPDEMLPLFPETCWKKQGILSLSDLNS